ncbi:hypothetical protein PYCCODRAFT_1376405, partial [Trametes coccinea BRFM310]
ALFCFDYMLTFAREVRRIWKLRFTTSAMLFYCVRYSALFNTIFVVLEQTQWKGPSLSVVFSALRAYALSGQNKPILIILLVLGSVNPVVTLVSNPCEGRLCHVVH